MNESPDSPQNASGVWVYLEHRSGALEGVSLELLGQARALAQETGESLTALLLGERVEPLAEEAIACGADRVLVAEHVLLAQYTTEPFTKVIAGLIVEQRPNVLLLGATTNGRDLAGRLAVRLRTGLTADCTDLRIDPQSGLLLGEVTGFGHGILATIECPVSRPQMATVRPGVFPRPVADPSRSGEIGRVEVVLSADDLPVRVIKQTNRRTTDVTQAERLVIGGRGMDGDFALLKRLAKAVRAEVGATRVAVDEGWVREDRMIGQTGSVTRPKLAIVCGVSGAMQFTVGIQDSETIVAINSDPDAPIFEVADYCVVEDAFRVIPPLIEALKSEPVGGKS